MNLDFQLILMVSSDCPNANLDSSLKFKYISDSHMRKKTRSTIVSLAVSFGVEDAYNQATAMFQEWRNGGKK